MTHSPTNIVLIPGLWLTALSWEKWVERYAASGHRVIAKSWPGMDGDIQALRRDPSAVANVGVIEVVEHYESIIRGLDSPPIIIGHSFGGLVTQILLDRGLGKAGVALDSAPAKGILVLPWSELKSGFPALKNPANSHRAVALTSEEFHYAFTNTMTEAESAKAYERYAVPGPGRVLFQAALANFNPHAATRIHFENDDRAPLLIIAGEKDHVSPPSVNVANAKLQHKSTAITAFKQFAGRPHFLIGAPGWEEIADFALSWASNPVELS
ncbi:MAG TPA: alpha/beta fold hydrolase [Polyangiaceae bacterium]|jgi:pimeloyl-ACP methyl ester carboxylesterase|nr:alpha/beta fold hydrolase [Polyangiaceae bacterium]